MCDGVRAPRGRLFRLSPNSNKALDVGELAVLWGIGGPQAPDAWVKDGALTPKLHDVYLALQKPADAGANPEDKARRQAVLDELAQGRPTLLLTDTIPGPRLFVVGWGEVRIGRRRRETATRVPLGACSRMPLSLVARAGGSCKTAASFQPQSHLS